MVFDPVYKKDYYKRRRKDLILRLGGKCFLCEEDREENLEFHHVKGDGESRIDKWKRLQSYLKAIKEGSLMVGCVDCHKDIESKIIQLTEEQKRQIYILCAQSGLYDNSSYRKYGDTNNDQSR